MLSAPEDQHIVEFHTGVVDPRDGTGECLPGDGSRVWRVVSSEVFDQKFVDSRNPVPVAAVQIITDRMILVLVGHDVDRVEDLILAADPVCPLEVVSQVRVVGISPLGLALHFVPGRPRDQHDVMAHLVISYAPDEAWIMLEDNDDIVYRLSDPSFFGDFQLGHPVCLNERICEVLAGFCCAVLYDLSADPGILGGQLGHSLVAGLRADRDIRICTFVQLAELVQPYKVPGVAQLHAGRIRSVEGIRELILVYHDTGGR